MNSFSLRSTFTVIVLLGVMAGGAVNARAQITFASPNTFAVGNAPTTVAVGDFNGDGKLDAAVASHDSNSISILLGDGTGGFAPAVNIAVDAGPTAVVTGDFNGDGKLDLVTAHPGSGFIRLRLGNGAGGFTVSSIQVAPTPQALAIGDFDNDGHPDVISANGTSNSVTLFRGNGAGGFSGRVTVNIGAAPVSITTGDFNRDGRLDFATANPVANNVTVGLGTAAFGFTLANHNAVDPLAVIAGDFEKDGVAIAGTLTPDGRLDLAVTSPQNFPNSAIALLVGKGSAGDFYGARNFVAGFVPNLAAAGDFDNDGKLDLAVTRALGDVGFFIFRGSDGGVTGLFNNTLSVDSKAIAVGDFNGDGKLDVMLVGDLYDENNPDAPPVGVAVLNLNTTFSATCSTSSFSSVLLSAAAGGPLIAVTADFDRDGKLDFATANNYSDNVTVTYGNGDGTFRSQVLHPVGHDPSGITTGDFNRDGILDLAVTNTFDDSVSILLGDAAGHFNPAGVFGVGGLPRFIVTGDFNADGKLDLAIANTDTDNVSILLGDGAGGFGPAANFPVGHVSFGITTGDFNGDGKLDLAVGSRYAGQNAILLGDGAGGFAAPIYFSGTADFLATGDFNRDGKLDLATPDTSSQAVLVLLGQGDGTFAPPVSYPVAGVAGVVAGDFSHDGKLDLAVTSHGPNSMTILRGDGAGGFVPEGSFPSGGTYTFTPVTGDFNRDGKLDLLATNLSSSNVTLFLNTCVDNGAPVAVDDSFAGRQATTLNVAAPGVLANDTDFENDPLTAILVTPPSIGTVTLHPDGSFVYTPTPDLPGTVSFTYKVSDGRHESNTATVSITINNPPTANNDSATLPEDSGPFSISVLVNDSADQFESISIVSVTQGAKGAVAIINNGQALTYTPTANAYGADSFTYTIRDNNGGLTATATVSISITEINDAPIAKDDYAEIPPNSAATIVSVLANDSTFPDPPTEILKVTAATQGAHGTVVITNGGLNLSYQPQPGFAGGDSFTYTISDGRGGTATATVTVDVPDTLTVTNNSDVDDGVCDANCSLREAIHIANGNISRTIIQFAPQVRGTIQLLNISSQDSDLSLSSRIDLRGPGANLLTVRGAGSESRVFFVTQGLTRISGLTISNGSTQYGGGGILNQADLLIQNCVITGNAAVLGGGISNSGNLLLDSCTLSGNYGGAWGGAIYSKTALTLRNCTLSGNIADGAGGALCNSDGDIALIESSTISGNTAPAGFGAGVASNGDTTRTEVHNSIISGNIGTDVDFLASSNNFRSDGFNLIGDGNAAGVFSQGGDVTGNTAPGLAALGYHGGPTPTRALLLGSPAINTGGATSLTSDQRGLARQSGPAVDKGAYELQPESYAFWSSYTFPANTPAALTAFNADADGDGLTNGLEQATGHNPLASEAPDTLVEFAIQNGNLVLQYERSITIDPTKLSVEQSLNLQLWTLPGVTYVNLGPASSTTELIQALIPINGAAKKFGRLRFTP